MAFCQGMLSRHQGSEPEPAYHDLSQAGAALQGEGHAQVGGAAGYGFGNVAGAEGDHAQGHLREVLPGAFNDGGHEIRGDPFHGGDFHVTGAQPFERVQLRACPFRVLQYHQGMAGEDLTGGGQPESTGQAFEQWRANFVLEFQDLPVDRGGRHEQAPCRFPYGAGAAYRVEVHHRRRMNAQPCAHREPL